MTVAAFAGLWLAVWVFVEMAGDVPKGEFEAWDGPLVRLVRGEPGAPQGSPAVVLVAKGITSLGSGPWLVAVSLGTLGWLARQRRWRALAVTGAGIGSAQIASSLLKLHFARVRPTVVPRLVEETSASFPSGHSLMSAMVYLTLGVLLARQIKRPGGQVAVVAGAFLLSFLIGVSRIYLGVHYPTDVLAGWAAGTAGAIVCSGLMVFWEGDRNRKPAT